MSEYAPTEYDYIPMRGEVSATGSGLHDGGRDPCQ